MASRRPAPNGHRLWYTSRRPHRPAVPVRTADVKDEWRHDVRITYTVTRADPIGGVQIHVRDLATALREQGHSPTVVTSGSGPFIDDLRAADIPVVVVRHLRADSPRSRCARLARAPRDAPGAQAGPGGGALLQGRRPEPAGRPVPRRSGSADGARLELHTGHPPRTAAVYRGIERSVGPLTAKIITVSEFDRRLTLEARIVPPARVVTVHNGIPDVSRQLRADPVRTPPRLVMVARFGAQKDHATPAAGGGGSPGSARGSSSSSATVRSWARCRRWPPRSTWASGCASSASGPTWTSDSQRRRPACSSTNWEGFPMSILEAMRAGLPVVASAIAGIGESVAEGESGFLVPRGDVDLLRARLRPLLASPELRARLGANGRARYEQEFTLSHFVARTLDVYRGVLADVKLPKRAPPTTPALPPAEPRGRQISQFDITMPSPRPPLGKPCSIIRRSVQCTRYPAATRRR